MPRRRSTQLALEGVSPAPGSADARDGLARPVKVAPSRPKQAERDFMRAVVEYATLMGWRSWHDAATNAPRACWHCGRRSTAPRNPAGWPDLVLVKRPRCLFVEIKAEGGVVTPEQQQWLDDLDACGLYARVWTPSDWEEIIRMLARD